MKKLSKLLETWTLELIEEQRRYYAEYYAKYQELNRLRKLCNDSYREIKDRLFNELYNNNYSEEEYRASRENMQEKLWEELNNLGFKYDKEHFIKTNCNGTTYEVEFEGLTLKNYDVVYLNGRRAIRTYNIVDNYFIKYHSAMLLSLMERAKSKSGLDFLNELAEVEIRKYVEGLIKKVEARYGKIKDVTDSNLSNIERVVFNCELGSCYLERITAGGYNIQRLHNRIIIKKTK